MKLLSALLLTGFLVASLWGCAPSPAGEDPSPASGSSSPSPSSASSASSSSSAPEEENGDGDPLGEFDWSSPQERYLFFTADDPEIVFEIPQGGQFAGWTADLVSFAGEDTGPDPVNLRASFSGSVPLSGEIRLYDDLSGSVGLLFFPDPESAAKVPRFYGENLENLYVLTLYGISSGELSAAFGEPQVRERVSEGETLSESFYPDCSILADSLAIQYGSDLEGRPTVGNVYILTAALEQNG